MYNITMLMVCNSLQKQTTNLNFSSSFEQKIIYKILPNSTMLICVACCNNILWIIMIL